MGRQWQGEGEHVLLLQRAVDQARPPGCRHSDRQGVEAIPIPCVCHLVHERGTKVLLTVAALLPPFFSWRSPAATWDGDWNLLLAAAVLCSQLLLLC